MKKKFLLLIMPVLFYLQASGQNWDMLNSGKLWSNLVITYNPNMIDQDLTTDFVKFDGDTTINAKDYKRVLQTEDSTMGNWILKGYIRETISEGLYFRNLQGEEGLLYKYNVKVGDSITIANKANFVHDLILIVKNIDSIQINGFYKKKYTMSQGASPINEIWIEGIGSLKGILRCGWIAAGGSGKLLCYYENKILMYKDTGYSECYYYTRTSINTINSPDRIIEIFPNPSHNEINITAFGLKRLKVYSIYGSLIDTIDLDNKPEITLNISEYPNGIYIIAPDGLFTICQKFVKL